MNEQVTLIFDKVCPHGHTTGYYASNRHCIECHLTRHKKKKNDPDYKAVRAKVMRDGRFARRRTEDWQVVLKLRLVEIKQRAKKKGLEFNISIEDFPTRVDVCPYLGIPVTYGINVNGKNDNKINNFSIDRIDNSKGYVHGNVQIISYRANTLKANGTLEEFEKLVEGLRKDRLKRAH